MISWKHIVLIFLIGFCLISVKCTLIGNENSGDLVHVCSESCDAVGLKCTDPDGSKDYCYKKSKIYCNTDIMIGLAEDDWVHYHTQPCVTDFCYVDCTKHIYYQPSRVATCDQNRAEDDDCQYPTLEEVMCECEDVVVDYDPKQFLTFRVKRGILLFLGMVCCLLSCQVMSRCRKKNR
jgi:hypothetical protein